MNTSLFLANLAVTVLLLVVTLVTGKRGRRRAHFIAAPLTVVSLTLAVWQAELYGRDFDFDAVRLNIHLVCAGLSLAALPGTIWTGLRLIRVPQVRLAHKRWVGIFVICTVLAVATACWMFLTAVPKA